MVLTKRKLVHDNAYDHNFHTAFSYDIDDHVIFFDDNGSIEVIDVKNREYRATYEHVNCIGLLSFNQQVNYIICQE